MCIGCYSSCALRTRSALDSIQYAALSYATYWRTHDLARTRLDRSTWVVNNIAADLNRRPPIL